MAELIMFILIIAYYIGQGLLVVLAMIIVGIIALIAYTYEALTTPSPETKLARTAKAGQQDIADITHDYREQIHEIINS